MWFAGEARDAREAPTFRRSEAFGPIGEEAMAVREAVGLFESSCYAKFEVTGPDATTFLDRITSNRLPQADGKTALAPLLTPKGRVFGDLTVTRFAADRYLMIGSPTAIIYYQRWFDQHRSAQDVDVRDVTAAWTGFSLTGPQARAVLAELVADDISHQAFPFLSARRMKMGLADAIVIRVSFTGELGYEIYTAPQFQIHVLERIRAAGKARGLRLCGMRALNALRLEKGYGS
ncbi:MAG: aminomethyltransferase family protein [Dongiaceae bacterium]